MCRWLVLCGWWCACLLTSGCGSAAERLVEVHGEVKLDGKPLPDGDVALVGDVGTVPAVLTVQNGHFQGKAQLGKKKVEIRAYRKVPPPPTATEMTEDFKENYLPDRYNTNSKLTAEVTSNGLNPSSFDAQSR